MIELSVGHMHVAKLIDKWLEGHEGTPLCRFEFIVVIKHQDGSEFKFTHAYMAECDGVLYVFSEHHPIMLFYPDDLEEWYQRYESTNLELYREMRYYQDGQDMAVSLIRKKAGKISDG
jgi:hypothetical protein